MPINGIDCVVDLVSLLEAKRFGVQYQPIVKLTDGEIFAYEALARFYTDAGNSVGPDKIYAMLHDSPVSLFQVELLQKKIQLENAPIAKPLFVNLDQDSYSSCGVTGEQNPFAQLFAQYTKGELIVELIENSEINDAIMSLKMIEDLSSAGIKTAIDDVFNPQCMISTSVIQLVDFLKLDKDVVQKKQDSQFLVLVSALIDYAHTVGKQVILEGVESEEDLLFARKLAVDYVQGYYYQSQFIDYKE